MSYYPKGQRSDNQVNDFDEYDATPYGGGYDISAIYGHPLDPSDDICYPIASSTSDDFDYDRPQYSSSAEPSAYGDEVVENEYKSYTRPKPRIGSSHLSSGGDIDDHKGTMASVD
ncbi:hypothetical protein Leryth_022897 [Lithospermum erythrorhizon]|nr:hypothetical protein Leryth_022897 [Lithospermum erythrorhizon]